MRALVKLEAGRGHIDLVERALLTPGRGEAVLEVLGAGVCGTDLHIEDGEFGCSPPVILGHEICGRVINVSADGESNWLGARVATETFYSTCRRCRWCRDGRPNLCPERRSIGVHVDGGFADQLVVPIANLHALPDFIDDHAGALLEPLACVCQALFDPIQAQPGDSVLVTGPGPVGLLAAQAARAVGAVVTVGGLAEDADRLAVASSLGFDVLDTEADPPHDVDVVIECSGSMGAAVLGLKALRRGGGYVQLGIFGRDVTVPLDELLYKELSYVSGFASTPRSWRRAMTLVTRGDVSLTPLVTEAAPLGSWRRVFSDLRTHRGMKIVFDPRLR